MSLAFWWDSVLPAPSSLLLPDHCTHFHITLIHGIMNDSTPAGYFPSHFLVATGATGARSGARSLWVLALMPSNPKRWQIRYPPSKEGRAGESSFSPSFIFPLTQESHFCSCDYRIISQVEKKNSNTADTAEEDSRTITCKVCCVPFSRCRCKISSPKQDRNIPQ